MDTETVQLGSPAQYKHFFHRWLEAHGIVRGEYNTTTCKYEDCTIDLSLLKLGIEGLIRAYQNRSDEPEERQLDSLTATRAKFRAYMTHEMRDKQRLNDLSEALFSSVWFAVLEYKDILERVIFRQCLLVPKERAVDYAFRHTLNDYQALRVNNTPHNLEEQADTYESLAKVTKLLDMMKERARQLDLF